MASWWSRFNDPLLNSLVNQALSANTSIGSAQAVLRQARTLRDVTAAGLRPELGTSASARRARSGNAGTAKSFNVGLDASWEFNVSGANRHALEQPGHVGCQRCHARQYLGVDCGRSCARLHQPAQRGRYSSRGNLATSQPY